MGGSEQNREHVNSKDQSVPCCDLQDMANDNRLFQMLCRVKRW